MLSAIPLYGCRVWEVCGIWPRSPDDQANHHDANPEKHDADRGQNRHFDRDAPQQPGLNAQRPREAARRPEGESQADQGFVLPAG